MSIITLGTLALDSIKTPSGERSEILGGSAAHFAMSARFFTRVSAVANVGKDFPERYINILKKKGIDLSAVKIDKGRTFRWEGVYKGDLNTATTLNTEVGVLASFNPKISFAQKKIKYVFLANVDPDIQFKFLKSIDHPSLIGLDSMNYWIAYKKYSVLKVLKKVDIYFANDAEARQLTKESNLIRATKKLRNLGPRIVIIKKGEHGALFYFDGRVYCLPAYPIEEIVDPTGAGDTFAGGLMGYLAKQGAVNLNTLKKAIAYGIVLSSFNVEGFGLDRMSRLKFYEVNSRLNKFIHNIKL